MLGGVQLIGIYKGGGTYTITADDVKKYNQFLCISTTGCLQYVRKNNFSVGGATIEIITDQSVSDGSGSTSTHNNLICYKVSNFKEGSTIKSDFNATWRYIGAILGIS